jgi:hypothetical protein
MNGRIWLRCIDDDLAIAEVVGPIADAHSMDGATQAGQTLDASNHTFHDNALKQRLKRSNCIVALAACGHCRGLNSSTVSAAMSIWPPVSILSSKVCQPRYFFSMHHR